MKRLAGFLSTLLCAVACPAVAPAASPQAAPGAVTGKITYVGASLLTAQTGGRPVGVINAMNTTARVLAARAYPYVYGGGRACGPPAAACPTTPASSSGSCTTT